jgi:rubredoxin
VGISMLSNKYEHNLVCPHCHEYMVWYNLTDKYICPDCRTEDCIELPDSVLEDLIE